MIKKRLYFVILFLLPLTTTGQVGMWTWMRGDTTFNSKGHYGFPKGVANAANNPLTLYEEPTWVDKQGKLWFYGGGDSANNCYGDLWMYDPTINEWAWMQGTGVPFDTGRYGIQGVASPLNKPSARAFGTASWTDLNGNFWLYGGVNGFYELSDLWEYNITSHEWIWIMGPRSMVYTPAVYGTEGVPAPTNTPGVRQECAATWVDANGDLWLFGGLNFNDLWRYNIASNEWTWMKGPSGYNSVGNYGIEGVPDTANEPPARCAYCTWTDNNGKFWLFGGTYDFEYALNDMWEFDPTTNNWTWMSGTNQENNTGSFGPQCSSSVNYYPPAMFENRARWVDDCGNLWLYGGGVGAWGDTMYDDLWRFNPSTLEWTLSKGSTKASPPRIYGKQGVPSATTDPGGLMGCAYWKGLDGYIYIFGGSEPGFLNYKNDVWRFKPDSSCGAATQKFSLGNDTSYCGTFSRVLETKNAATQWSTGATAPQITVTAPGTYWAKIVTKCGTESDTIHISNLGPPAAFSIGNDTAYCSAFSRVLSSGNATTNWSTGVTGAQITVNAPGTYWASISNTCGTTTDTIHITTQSAPAPFSLGKDTFYCGQVRRTLITGVATTLWSTGATAPQINISKAGTYWANITNVCGSASDTIHITLLKNPPPFSLGADTTYCGIFNRTLETDSANTVWSTGATGFKINVSKAGTYWASISNTCGTTTDTIKIDTSHHLDLIDIGNDTTYCSSFQRILFTGIPATHWSTGEVAPQIEVYGPGAYWAVVSNSCGTQKSTINLWLTPAPNFTLGADTGFCTNIPYKLFVPQSVLYDNYYWQDNSTGTYYTVTQPGTYKLVASNACGIDSASKTINIQFDPCYVMFPNAFSPNGDGVNDVFMPTLPCINQHYILKVFNRWGQQVFETEEMDKGWDGRVNVGGNAPIGSYAYYAEYYSECEQKIVLLKGTVVLLR